VRKGGKNQGKESWGKPSIPAFLTYLASLTLSISNQPNYQLTNSIEYCPFEKLRILHLDKKRFIFYKPESSLPCTQQPTTFPYPQSNKSSP
jgi:hypothetical protein